MSICIDHKEKIAYIYVETKEEKRYISECQKLYPDLVIDESLYNKDGKATVERYSIPEELAPTLSMIKPPKERSEKQKEQAKKYLKKNS